MKILRATLLLAFLFALFAAPAIAERENLRVGVFPMRPLNFVDEGGNAQGLNPDLLREIFYDEQWQLVFVPGSWGECYDRLMKGEIDLLTTVAHSPDRETVFDFNREPVADIWGKIYIKAGSKVSDIRDLSGKAVAIARKDINGSNFLKTAKKFDVKPFVVEVETHYDIFSAVQKGEVLAGVVPQHFGFREAENYGLVPTTIEFEPFSVFFAIPKGKNTEVLKLIDEHLAAWKGRRDSYYFKRVAYWMGGVDLEPKTIPRWVYMALLSTLGGIVFFIVVSLSLKQQVRLRTAEIASREALFRRLSETTKAVPWELDLKSKTFTYIGPRVVDVFGYPQDEWRDMDSWVQKLHPEDRAWAVDICNAETARGNDHDFTYRCIHKDGRIIWVHDVVTVAMGANGPEKLYGYFVDITELREHEQLFQKMFREHYAVMLLVDPDSGQIVDANDAACKYYGYKKEQIISIRMENINTLSRDEVFREMQAAKDRQQNHFEFKHRLANGDIRDIEAYSYPIMIDNKPILFSIIHDVTERNKLLAESGRNAQLAALGTIAAGVAHEINNPIQGIINYADLLTGAPDNKDRVVDIAQRVKKEGVRIAKITRELLNYSRDNRNEMHYSNITELIEDALSLITTKIQRSGISVIADLDKRVPKVLVNSQGIQQIVINLVDNSYDALKHKQIPVDTKAIKIRSCVAEIKGKPHFSLEVSDNGIGMSEAVVKKARDVFFSTKPSSEGTGLGLSIVSEIVAKHQGQLDIESKEDEYTRVKIVFPITLQLDS